MTETYNVCYNIEETVFSNEHSIILVAYIVFTYVFSSKQNIILVA
jgi:hypothetical protein